MLPTSGAWKQTDKPPPEVPFRYSGYFSGRENIRRVQWGFSQGKEMKTFHLSGNRKKLFEEESQEASRREPRPGGLALKARLAGLQDQGHAARLSLSIHLPSPCIRRPF